MTTADLCGDIWSSAKNAAMAIARCSPSLATSVTLHCVVEFSLRPNASSPFLAPIFSILAEMVVMLSDPREGFAKR